MRIAFTEPTKCAFCAFRFLGEKSSVSTLYLRHDGARRHRSFGSQSRNSNYSSKPPARDTSYQSKLATLQPRQSAYAAFGKLLQAQCDVLERNLLRNGEISTKAWGIKSVNHLRKELDRFRDDVQAASDKANQMHLVSEEDNRLFHQCRTAFITGHTPALAAELKLRFMNSVIQSQNAAEAPLDIQKKLADLRYPLEWYPATRALQREVHLHVGPTNSGKTYHALKRLEEAKTGIFAGPLRLLAHEVYTRFNAKGKKCALITGEERRVPDGLDALMHSCTVEMVPLNSLVDVAVIDEIQMIGDSARGWAWTQAFLGILAKELHLCGEVRTVPLIKQLCTAMGDKLIVHRYERLGPLQTENRSLGGDLRKLQKGDAVILFSRLAIHAMKSNIEKITGKRCAVVYGSLPPETRAQQAALFNDPDNEYEYLVASDAVGMGLNLSIKRVIFESTTKHDGVSNTRLAVPQILQIAGRAGRFRSARDAITIAAEPTSRSKPNVGLVTTLEEYDMPVIKSAMRAQVEPLQAAGILPPTEIIARFAGLFPPETPFSYIILRLHELAASSSQFFMCHLKDQVEMCDIIQQCKMSIKDRLVFMAAPVALRDPGFTDIVVELAQCVSNQTGGELLSIKSMPLEILDQEIDEYPGGSKGYLRSAETLHKATTLYLWLSYRFAGVFRSQALAFHVKALIEDKINQCLDEIHDDLEALSRQRTIRHKKLKKEEKLKKKIQIDNGTSDVAEAGATDSAPQELLQDSTYTPAAGSNIPIPLHHQVEGSRGENVSLAS